MSLWKKKASLAQLNKHSEATIMQHLNIEFTDITDDSLTATMPVNTQTHQPMGLLHGGASVVLAETLGSTAGTLACAEGYVCVGLEINANHIRAVSSGTVTGNTTALHIGRTTQVWQITIRDDQQKVCCISRITLSVIQHPKP